MGWTQTNTLNYNLSILNYDWFPVISNIDI